MLVDVSNIEWLKVVRTYLHHLGSSMSTLATSFEQNWHSVWEELAGTAGGRGYTVSPTRSDEPLLLIVGADGAGLSWLSLYFLSNIVGSVSDLTATLFGFGVCHASSFLGSSDGTRSCLGRESVLFGGLTGASSSFRSVASLL